MKKMLRNKKGAGILDSIGNIINGITNIIPAPLLFVIFLFILATVGWLISIIFNATGIYCNSANQPVQLNTNVFANVGLISDVPELSEIGRDAVEGNSKVCRTQLTESDGSFFIQNTSTYIPITGQKYYYTGTYCAKCTIGILKDKDNKTITGFFNGNGEYCIDRAYATPADEKTWWQNVVCNSDSSFWGSCEPPTGYYFNQDYGLYSCNSQTCAEKTIGTTWDEKLSSKGAKLIYQETSFDPSSDKFLGITCSELHPRLGIYGIDLLTYTNWLIITVIILLFWMWKELA